MLLNPCLCTSHNPKRNSTAYLASVDFVLHVFCRLMSRLAIFEQTSDYCRLPISTYDEYHGLSSHSQHFNHPNANPAHNTLRVFDASTGAHENVSDDYNALGQRYLVTEHAISVPHAFGSAPTLAHPHQISQFQGPTPNMMPSYLGPGRSPDLLFTSLVQKDVH